MILFRFSLLSLLAVGREGYDRFGYDRFGYDRLGYYGGQPPYYGSSK
jgi:hypothetical protein